MEVSVQYYKLVYNLIKIITAVNGIFPCTSQQGIYILRTFLWDGSFFCGEEEGKYHFMSHCFLGGNYEIVSLPYPN